MENFIDTCIILGVIDKKDKFHTSCLKFSESKSGMIICFYQKLTEIPYLIKRLKLISRIIKIKAFTPSKSTPEISSLLKKDKIKIQKILADYELGLLEPKDIFKIQEKGYITERKINSFIKTKIKRVVVPIKDIPEDLREFIFQVTNNKADSYIFSSAVKENKKNEIIFVTNDKNDFNEELRIKISKKTKYKDVPEIKNLN